MKPHDNSTQVMIKQVFLLIVILGAIAALMLFKPGTPNTSKTKVQEKKGINTEFNVTPLEQFSGKGSEYPNVTPRDDELNKTDPFGA